MKAQSASVTVQNLLLTKIQLFWSLVQRTDYTRKYDLDLVREVASDQIARRVVLLSDQAFGLENVKEVALGCGGVLNDIYRVFPYIVYAQLFALLTSLKVENKPDTPSPTGTSKPCGTRCDYSRIPKVRQCL